MTEYRIAEGHEEPMGAHHFALRVTLPVALAVWAGLTIVVTRPEAPVTCGSLDGNATECTSPGNVEINGTPPEVNSTAQNPYWDVPNNPVVGPPVIGPPHIGGVG